MELENIATIVGSILGGGVVGSLAAAWVSRYQAQRSADNADNRLTFDRDKFMSDTQQRLVDQAMDFQGRYEEENAKLSTRIIELQQLIQTEQTARRRDAADCKAAINQIGQTKDKQIGLLQAEITVLRNQITSLKGQNTQLRSRVSELEKNGHGTGELKEKRKKENSTFIDPPPSQEAPGDWN